MLKSSGQFDAAWYQRTYPDVTELGMDPAEHYLTYGQRMGRMSSLGERINLAVLEDIARLPTPNPKRALLEAHEIARGGRDGLGIAYARKHVPPEFAYTIEALRANAELRQQNEQGWLKHLNTYLAKFGAAPIHLGEGDTLPDRFRTKSLTAVTGGPLVSVIMSAWNAEKTVRAAAFSILNQTWRNLELLIVDDFSEDKTWGNLQTLAAADSRVKIFRNKINVGPYVSKNIMLSMARGDWITGHDADDWAHPQRLEHHMQALQQFPTPPRASISFMTRLEPDGVMDRFAPISSFSLDGVARDAAISCTFEQSFLRKNLGGWDNVRFGADSELIARSQTLIGDEFKRLPLLSMLCMNYDESLTNNADFGVSRMSGPSEARVQYSKSWGNWHKTLPSKPISKQRLPFPPVSEDRLFDASEVAVVPLHRVRRNFSAHTGIDPICNEAVTAICPSKRPWFAERVAKMMGAQTHANLHIIYVAHGPEHDIPNLNKVFSKLPSVTILELPDADQPLGAALNMALEHCTSDLCAKIDDDDFYGPNYIRSSLAALRYNGHEGVGIVGRERAYVYVEETDVTGLRYAANHENTLRSRVFGGTIFWSRAAVSDQRFLEANTGEDTDFFRKATDKQVKIFSAEPADYVHVRYNSPGAHTWNVPVEDFMRPATVLAKGLRPDLAYSSQYPQKTVPIPSRSAFKKEDSK